MFEVKTHNGLANAVAERMLKLQKPKTSLVNSHAFTIDFECGSFLVLRAVDAIYDEDSALPEDHIKNIRVNLDSITVDYRGMRVVISYNNVSVTFVCSHFNYSLA